MRNALTVLLLLLLSLPAWADEIPDEDWAPSASIPKIDLTVDWIRLTNGEWLNGEIISLRNRVLLFDSDHFDEISIDWEDIAELHSAGDLIVVLGTSQTLTGKISMAGGVVVIRGKGGEKTRAEITSIIPKRKTWWETWDGRFSVGLALSAGNTDQLSLAIDWDAVYRTAFNRFSLNYTGNMASVSKTAITNNHTVILTWNRFIGDRLYVTPIGYSFYNNIFQNIQHQSSLQGGIGYMFIDKSKLEWDGSAGLGYQYTRYDSVDAGSDKDSNDLIVSVSTVFDADITKDIEWIVDYLVTLNFVSKFNFTQTVKTSLTMDITNDLELDLGLVWDFVLNPQQRSDGSTPDQNDLNLTLGIAVTY